jgi:hypothetical protein
VRLSRQQRRTLEAIKQMQDAGEDGHDFCGDLSVCSANHPATMTSLMRRGLVDGSYDWMQPPEEAWTYRLTVAGYLALSTPSYGEKG